MVSPSVTGSRAAHLISGSKMESEDKGITHAPIDHKGRKMSRGGFIWKNTKDFFASLLANLKARPTEKAEPGRRSIVSDPTEYSRGPRALGTELPVRAQPEVPSESEESLGDLEGRHLEAWKLMDPADAKEAERVFTNSLERRLAIRRGMRKEAAEFNALMRAERLGQASALPARIGEKG
jgi:hypothetical protein